MRRRLATAIAAVAAAAVVAFAVPLALTLAGDNRANDLLRLQRDAFAATRQIDVTPGARDPVELPATSLTLTVYDAAGGRIAGRGPASAPPVVRAALRTGRPATAGGGGPLVVAVPLVASERVSGAVRALRARGTESGDTAGQWAALAVLALAIIAAAVAAALALSRSLTRPLERLAAEAGRLGHGDFTVRPPHAGVPELDAVGEALATTASRLGDLVDRERAFSTGASHQLRTPLQALRIDLEAIEMRPGAPPEVGAALEEVDRLEATIATLLDVARGAHGTAERQTDLATALDEAERRWHGPLAAASRPLFVTLPSQGELVSADPRVVDQILDVLLDNALRHGAGAVRLTTRDLGGWQAVEVSDEGPGFAGTPDLRARRADPGADGHGIGLAIAQSLAHAQGGGST